MAWGGHLLDSSFWHTWSVEMDGFSSRTDSTSVTRESSHLVSFCDMLSRLARALLCSFGGVDGVSSWLSFKAWQMELSCNGLKMQGTVRPWSPTQSIRNLDDLTKKVQTDFNW